MSDLSRKTKQDAFEQVLKARMFSLGGHPTEEYLLALREQAYAWIEEIESKLHQLNSTTNEEMEG